jgi:hypothetical protein
MQIRIKETGAVVLQRDLRDLYPNTSGPLDNLYDVVFEGPQAQATRYQHAYRDGVEQIEGKWYTKYSVVEMGNESKAAVDAAHTQAMRDNRNRALSASDWTQLADAPVDKVAWATYRQSLRDITLQTRFPWTIDWPVAP